MASCELSVAVNEMGEFVHIDASDIHGDDSFVEYALPPHVQANVLAIRWL